MSEMPKGVSVFTPEASKRMAASNFVVSVHGAPKAGKSHFAFRSVRPLYLVYLDTNPAVHTHLLKSSEVYGDEVYQLIIAPVAYDKLTQDRAKEILDQIEEFAEWAKASAIERGINGQPGGTFVIDGMTIFKGYCEKAILGESVTLGFRPKQGEHSGISTYDYAKSNAAVFEFVAGFAGAQLDACFVWEGRPIYKDVVNSRGKVESKRTDSWKSTRPERMPYAINAEVEMLMALERIDPANNQSPLISVPKLRVVLNSENIGLNNMVIPAKDFQGFKQLLLDPVVGSVTELQAIPAAAVIRANEAGFPLVEVDLSDDDEEE